MVVLLAAACSGDAAAPSAAGTPARSGRFGSLRDLVLFERPDLGPAAGLFVDRFEVTRGDWAEFAASAAGQRVGAEAASVGGGLALPISSVDLRQARAFARWRLLRLPRRSEWEFAAVGDGRSRFPWGSRVDATRANTVELGLGAPTAVGTFESGRRAGGDQPYDLVGNVSEWTESVPLRWCEPIGERDSLVLDPVMSLPAARQLALRHAGLRVWAAPAALFPAGLLAELGGEQVPHEVVGGDFQRPMLELSTPVPAGDRRSGVGLRLCATVQELLQTLRDDPLTPTESEWEQLRRFVARGRHRTALVQAWRQLAPASGGGPIAAWLATELAGAAGDDR